VIGRSSDVLVPPPRVRGTVEHAVVPKDPRNDRLVDAFAQRAAHPRLPKLRRVCHYCSAGLPTYCLIKLQFRDWLRIRIRTRTRTGH
jgi:hypothetical protein